MFISLLFIFHLSPDILCLLILDSIQKPAPAGLRAPQCPPAGGPLDFMTYPHSEIVETGADLHRAQLQAAVAEEGVSAASELHKSLR